MLNIYLSNLAKANIGEANGKWINLPMDEEKLKKIFLEIVGKDAEHLIMDYSWSDMELFKIGEYDSAFELNKRVKELSTYSIEQKSVIIGLLSGGGVERFDEALKGLDRVEIIANLKEYEITLFSSENMLLKEWIENTIDGANFAIGFFRVSSNCWEKIPIDYERVAREVLLSSDRFYLDKSREHRGSFHIENFILYFERA